MTAGVGAAETGGSVARGEEGYRDARGMSQSAELKRRAGMLGAKK